MKRKGGSLLLYLTASDTHAHIHDDDDDDDAQQQHEQEHEEEGELRFVVIDDGGGLAGAGDGAHKREGSISLEP